MDKQLQATTSTIPDELDQEELAELLATLGLSDETARREYQGILDRFNSLTSWQGGPAKHFAQEIKS
ncbi:hypothetical protein [uncultured Mameliella sp.]|uniref:hypothetical protein n=1 Tax=uncultured Mameliella sp. TaxID=1447087 RepID=UPI0026104066|nr:hypothetical protein [uncultured Mameliella sp.]